MRPIWITVLLLFGLAPFSYEAQGAEDLILDLRLNQGLMRKGKKGTPPQRPGLFLQLRRTNDQWARVIGIAGKFCQGTHVGYVSASNQTEDTLTIDFLMNIYGDAWVKGGTAEYSISLKKTKDLTYQGTWKGTFRGDNIDGTADGFVIPQPQKRGKITPIQPGEHPRLLFRKSDLPHLKAKAATPFGKACLKKMTDGIGLAVKYQLTGDKKYAEEARKVVERRLNGDYKGIPYPYDHHGMSFWGLAWEEVAVGYDCCYDVWPEEFKKRCERYIYTWTNRLFYQRIGFFNTQGQYDFGNSDEGAWLFYGLAMGALALWGEKGPEPAKPIPVDPVTEVAPSANYTPGQGVPVVKLLPGKSPNQWIYTKPMNHLLETDPLEALGGFATCKPEVGTSYEFEGKTYSFEKLPDEFVPKDGGLILNIAKSIKAGHQKKMPGPEMIKDGPMTQCFFTVLENDKPRYVKVNAGFTRWGTQQFVLNGKNLAHGQVVKLEKGKYPALDRDADRRTLELYAS